MTTFEMHGSLSENFLFPIAALLKSIT